MKTVKPLCARPEQSGKPPRLHRDVVEGQQPRLLRDSGLGGRHCGKSVTNIRGIPVPREARCCQSPAKRQQSRHAFAWRASSGCPPLSVTCWRAHLGTYRFIQLENKKYNLSQEQRANSQAERLF